MNLVDRIRSYGDYQNLLIKAKLKRIAHILMSLLNYLCVHKPIQPLSSKRIESAGIEHLLIIKIKRSQCHFEYFAEMAYSNSKFNPVIKIRNNGNLL